MNLEVYARSSAERMVALRSKLPLVSEQSPTAWIQVALVGTWEGHSSGAFEFNRETFERIVANFDGQANPIPLTYEHPQYAGDGRPVPAAGWIHELAIRGEELWAQVEFTPRAAQMVRDGEYRFCSVVVAFDSTDRKTGEGIGPELYEVGLTNVPFIDGMKPIRLSRARRGASAPKEIAMSMKDILKEALDVLPDDATADQVAKFIRAKEDELEAIEGVGDPSPPDDVDEEPAAEMSADKPAEVVEASADTPATVELMEDEPALGDPEDVDAATETSAAALVDTIAAAIGTDAAGAIAALQENLDAVTGLLMGQPDSGTVADDPTVAGMARDAGKAVAAALSRQVQERDAKIAALSKDVEALKDAALQRRIQDAIESGHILDADRDKMVKLGRKAPDLLEEFLVTAADAPAVPVAPYKASGPAARNGATALDDFDPESPEYQRYEVQLRHAIKDPAKRHEVICSRLSARAERGGL